MKSIISISLSLKKSMPSQIRITADDRGPLVNLANWVTLVVACLATLTKIATKLRKIRRLQGDDYIMLAAMVSSSLLFNICLFEINSC